MNKWVFSYYGIHLHQLIENMEQLGYNGLVLHVPDHITEATEWHPFIPPLVAHCNAHNIELIPMMCAVGKLNHYLKTRHPEFIEMMPLEKAYIRAFNPDEKYVPFDTHNPQLHVPASVIQTDGKLQMAGCMAEPALFAWYIRQMDFIIQCTNCTKIFLSLDEIRAGGTCERCKHSEMSKALSVITNNLMHINGIEFYAWGDMFDPTHNARHPYFWLSGSTEGALDLILEAHPDFKVVAWNENPIYWMENDIDFIHSFNIDENNFHQIPTTHHNRIGYMYTTWRGDYTKLVDFRDAYFPAVGGA